MIKSRQFTKGQKFFIIMAIFVCGLLFYANGVAFNLISAPMFVNDIIAYAALTVAVTLTVITLTIVIRDKRKGLFVKTQKSNVDNVVELDQASVTVSSPAIAHKSMEKVDSIDQVIQTIEGLYEVAAAVLPATKVSKRRSLFAAIIGIVVGLLVYVNIVAFGLFALPVFSMYVAVAGAAGLIGVVFVVSLAEKRRGAFAKIQKSSVVSAVKESNEPLETVPSAVDFQESTSVVETDGADIHTLNVSDEAQVSVLPKAKSSKKRSLLIFIISIAVGLLFVANCVAFGLISLPGYSAYAFVAGASALTIITVALALVDKRKGVLPKAPIVVVIGAIKESNAAPETPDTVSSPTIAQASTKKVDSYAELLRQFSVQKTTSKLADTIEHEKQLPKKTVIPPTKVICPACRKEFNLPIYEKDYIVDFGPLKKSTLIKICPNCKSSVPLKRSGILEEEDIWRE